MQILLTNDDGIYAPGLAAMARKLTQLGEVSVVAPANEQSGVGHSITFLTPLMAKEVFDGERQLGWAVEGSPADCVKLALAELCPSPPDLIISGINGGLNVGINILYSGTVAAATEGALFDIPSIAVSLEYDEHARFDDAADLSVGLIRQILDLGGASEHHLYNINIPTVALDQPKGVKTVSMAVARWPAEFERRLDPKGRHYYWASGNPPRESAPADSDVAAIADGYVTVTPLIIDRTASDCLAKMQQWSLTMPGDKTVAKQN